MVTAIDFLNVRMGKRADNCLLFFLTLLLVLGLIEHLIFLTLHPLDVLDLQILSLEVKASLPVSLTLVVLLLV